MKYLYIVKQMYKLYLFPLKLTNCYEIDLILTLRYTIYRLRIDCEE